ncbi:Crinkler (CRN) [Phytophthora megakarya]|uniref:Crinkler (CRN) n=1 Tax=Phytophthora megakarya TaxID=4795 RepID=A0A225VJK0_9STRA|nr:Crinkler (CRN) [Phytophthora megakarya]
MTQQSNSPIVRTPDLHEFWKGFGEFPPYYFVRMEECVFWKVIKPLLFGENRVVIIGSPGVGKSCFLMLIAFYLACIKKKKVLVLRRLKEKNAQNALVFLDGVGSYARLKNLSSHELHTIRQQVDTAIRQKDGDAIVLVDGFRQDDLHLSSWIEPFHCLATSCQFDAKHDDRAEIVVLPAWSETNLLQYAKSTNWVIDTGLRKIKNLIDTTWRKLVNEQYFYSGGSLREFCKEREVLKLRVAKDCRYVNNAQAFDFVYNYGGGQSKDQVDRLRRHYISDCTEEKHYYDSTYWKLYVDSGYVLSELGRIIDVDKQLEIYKYAKAVGAGFHGVAYEQLLHTAVRGAIANGTPIVLELKEGSKYEKIEIQVSNVICMGDNEALCYPCLSQLGHDTYWYPNYPFFPFIDAVTSCYAFPKGGNPKKIVAYIQVTIRSEKKFKDDRLRKLNEQMDQNELLKDMERVFVVVGPDSGVCERFTLRDAPDPETFLTMVSCFNPEQLESKAS